MTLSEALAAMERDPGVLITVAIEELSAGWLVRRQVRHALKTAEVNGANVVWSEERGLFDSLFAVRMSGTGKQLKGPCRTLLDLSGGAL